MLRAMMFLISSMILISSCSYIRPNPTFSVPDRDALPKAEWTRSGDTFCTTEEGAKNILKREAIRDGYEAQLKTIIEHANKALAK